VSKISQILSINAPSRRRRVLASIGSSLLLALSASPLHAATFNVPDGDLAALQLAILDANSNGESDTINLAANGVYQFTQVTPNPLPIGQTTALPAITTGMVINGNNSRFIRPEGFPDNFRFLFKSGPDPLEVNDLTFANGLEVSGSDTFSGGGRYCSYKFNWLIQICKALVSFLKKCHERIFSWHFLFYYKSPSLSYPRLSQYPLKSGLFDISISVTHRAHL